MKQAITNERGQATTAALIILPVALTLFCGAIVLIFALVMEGKATAACRVSMVADQKAAAQALNELMALNPAAERLEQSRQAAKVALTVALVSGNPPAIASARAALSAIEMMQKPVALKQRMAFARGKWSSLSASPRAHSALRSSLPQNGGPAGKLTGIIAASVSPESKSARFDVIATPPGARTPTYRPAPDFVKSQEARVRWLLPMPSQGVSPTEGTKTSVQVGCAVTLQNGADGKWVPQITEDKLLPN